MERNTNLDYLMFDVELRPVGMISETQENSSESAADSDGREISEIEKYKAVVRKDTGEVFAVVSSRYELLPNSRALDLGKAAFQLLFPEAKATDFIPYDSHMTKTGSACHIDLIHKEYNTEVWEQETWLPFLRVSNSYNRSRALTFDFGFVRELCSNGMIFQKESIKAKFYHTKGELNIDLKQDAQFQKLKALEAEFSTHMKRLREIQLTKDWIRALSLHLLGLEFDLQHENPKRREVEHERLSAVRKELDSLATKYVNELGESAYTALNVATDLATHSPSVAGKFANTAALQGAIGERLHALSNHSRPARELAQSEFDLLTA